MPWKQNDETGEMYWVEDEYAPSPDYSFTKPDYSLGGGSGSSYGGININDVTYTPSGGISVKGGGEGLDVNDYTYKPGVGIVYTGGGGTGSGMSFSGVDAGGSPTSVRAPESSLGGLGGLLKSFGNIVSGKQKIGGDNGVGLDQLMSLFLMGKLLTGGKDFTKPQVAGYKGSIPNLTATRTAIAQPAYVPYSGKAVMGGKQLSDVTYAAEGGIMGLARGGAAKPPRYLDGPTDGMADKINTDIDGQQPAKLSHGEFVIPADVVSHLGNGNSKAGANVLYSMMDRVRKARTGTKKQGKQINPAKFMPGGIAGYAGGGAVAFNGTTGSSVTTPPTGSSTTSNLSEWAGPYVTGMLGKAQALTEQPYQAYQGPLTAGYSPLQQQAFTGYGNYQTPAAIGQAAQTAGNIAGQMQGLQYNPVGTDFTAQAAQQYMNPYIQAALNPQLEELNRQNQITQMGQQAKLAQAGAFGGSRDAIMRSENARNLGQLQAQVLGTGYATAYDKAMQQFNADQARKVGESQFGAQYGLQGLQNALQAAQTQGNLGVQQGQLGLQGLAAQLGAGEQQRAVEQQGIAAKQAEFEKQRLYPYQQLQFQQSMLQGLPVSTYSNTQNTSGLQDLSAIIDALRGLGSTTAEGRPSV